MDVTLPETISVTANFDPPVIGTGGKTFYRINVDVSESAFGLPEKLPASAELNFGPAVHGQIARLMGNKFRPLTSYLFEVQAATPGHFTVSNFTVNVLGRSVEIPAAGVEVVAPEAAPASPRRLMIEAAATNLFLGQPFRLRVLLPADQGRQIEALREMQFNGGGFMTDKTVTRQVIEPVNVGGQLKPAFIYETVATPIATGPLNISAQAFSAGRDFGGPISITGQVVLAGGAPSYALLTSEPLTINVRPLPAGELPGFTGALGKFLPDQPQLSANRLRVGEPLHLKLGFVAAGALTRFVPPAPPRSREWQVIPDKSPAVGFTLIPQTDEAHATPAIPFSAFDPVAKKFYDLSIPALPVTVVGDGLPVQVDDANADENQNPRPLKLSAAATTPGKSVATLKPLQLQGWFVCLQLLPLLGLFALWRWDEQRRFLAAHPEIVRRRKAKRDLRREKRNLEAAVAAGDGERFGAHAVAALRIAVAPHFPAEARALVGSDVLTPFSAAEAAGPAGETVRKLFAAADARFRGTSVPPVTSAADQQPTSGTPGPLRGAALLALKPDLDQVLQRLEEKL